MSTLTVYLLNYKGIINYMFNEIVLSNVSVQIVIPITYLTIFSLIKGRI